MSFLTVDMEELRKSWMKLYLNLMSLKSHDPAVAGLLEEYTMKFAEMNETMMTFFDAVGPGLNVGLIVKALEYFAKNHPKKRPQVKKELENWRDGK